MASKRHLHTSHWGAFEAEVEGGAVVAVHPYRDDPDPSPLLGNITGSLRHRARIRQPMVRAGWLDRGPGPGGRRGAEPFVPVTWPTAIDLLSRELRRVYDTHGGAAVYGGSYGWASAGRFHHAQSQLHRFLNCLGGFVRGEHSYSNGALTVIIRPEDAEGLLDAIEKGWGKGVAFKALVASQSDNTSMRSWWARYQRLAASPGAAVTLLRRAFDTDARTVLSTIRVPR